jgi:hypothetical protein
VTDNRALLIEHIKGARRLAGGDPVTALLGDGEDE